MHFIRNAKKKREKRARKALQEGRPIGVRGRPPLIDKESEEVIHHIIMEDAKIGIFHDLLWLEQMVFTVFA